MKPPRSSLQSSTPHRRVFGAGGLPFVGILIFFGGSAFFAAKSTCAIPNTTLHFDSWVEFSLEKLETDGVTGGFHRHTRPRTRWEVARAIRGADERIASGRVKPAPIHVELLDKLKREFERELAILFGPETGHRFRMRGSAQLRTPRTDSLISPGYEGAFHYDVGRRITMYQEFEVGEFSEKYPIESKSASRRIKSWHSGYTADFNRIYLRFPVSKIDVIIGRDQIFWGTGFRGAVGISDNSPPFDLVLLTGQFGRVKGTAFTAQLDQIWHDQDGPTRRYLANRYLAGHRLDWQVNDRVEVGISELILYGGNARGVEWQYFNPILPYYASQYNSNTDDNVMFLLEGAIRPVDGARLYGEWLIDDFQYAATNDPNAVAWLAGAECNGLLASKKLSVRAEYARVNRWAYTHLVQENQFTHFGSFIGHRIGTDADTFYVEGGYLINADAFFALAYEFERQGEAGVGDRFRDEDSELIPFPSGVVERRDCGGFRFVYEPRRSWQLDFSYQYVITRNQGNQSGVRKRSNELEFQLRYLFELSL